MKRVLKEENMTATPMTGDTLGLLARNGLRYELASELDELGALTPLSREQVAVVLGQWYHPLHYFPVFLSRLIAVTPRVEMQTHISRILWQELGAGDSKKAHELIYISTMADAGFSRDQVAEAAPFEGTERLTAGYEQASENYLSGLGFMYTTEVADLAMVSTIGKLVRRCAGSRDLPWVDIHVEQEPDHVESSRQALKPSFTAEEQRQIVESGGEMWRLWIDFFRGIKEAIS
jgi:pyrroloquinoline quinone (PQQ) biosynthesis protein C